MTTFEERKADAFLMQRSMMTEEAAKQLRAPFDPAMIGKLPRAGIQLDYVGHAAVTDRLLSVDPEWSWEPFAVDTDGGPLVRYGAKECSMWIRLTICGVTRPGVGIVLLTAFELEKQLISDALRNAAMRFGVALDLWSKQDLDDRGHDDRPDRVVTTTADLGNVDAMGPRELNDALRDLGLPLGGTLDEMRERLREITGAGEPSPGAESVAGSAGDGVVTGTPAASPAPVSTGDGQLLGEVEGPSPLTLDGADVGLGSSPSAPSGYDGWPNADLLAECAVHEIEMPKSATKERMVKALRVWDTTYRPGYVEENERPF